MTAAGLDPSRIQERATLLAKVQGAKRKWAAEMDVDMEDGDGDGEHEADWMDVDGEDTPNKRVKGNGGRAVAVNLRAPRTNRQLAGMRDEGVCHTFLGARRSFIDSLSRLSASIQGRQTAQSWTEATQYACQSRRKRSGYQSQNGMWLSALLAAWFDQLFLLLSRNISTVFSFFHLSFQTSLIVPFIAAGKRKGGKTDRR